MPWRIPLEIALVFPSGIPQETLQKSFRIPSGNPFRNLSRNPSGILIGIPQGIPLEILENILRKEFCRISIKNLIGG